MELIIVKCLIGLLSLLLIFIIIALFSKPKTIGDPIIEIKLINNLENNIETAGWNIQINNSYFEVTYNIKHIQYVFTKWNSSGSTYIKVSYNGMPYPLSKNSERHIISIIEPHADKVYEDNINIINKRYSEHLDLL